MRLLLLRLLAALLRPFARRAGPQPPHKILYLKPDHLGDVLLATPALAALRARFPQAEIVAMVGPWSAAALQRNPSLDALRTLPFPGFTRRAKRSPLAPYTLLAREAWKLRRERFDLAVLGRDDHWWGALLALAAGIPARAGFAHPLCRPLLTRALPLVSHEHVAAQALRLAGALGPQAGIWEPEDVARAPSRFVPSPEARGWAREWLAAQGIAPGRLLLIHPGTGGPSKHWSVSGWSAVAEALGDAGWSVVLTGGPGEEGLVAQVAERMARPAAQLAGRTSVDELGALMEQARLALGVDSGPLHLAAAVGTPSVRLYGPSERRRFGPWGEPARQIALEAGLWCAPCGIYSRCPRGAYERGAAQCMASIDAGAVLSAAESILAQEEPHRSAQACG